MTDMRMEKSPELEAVFKRLWRAFAEASIESISNMISAHPDVLIVYSDDAMNWAAAEVPGTAPDGCTLDAGGGIWFSDALGQQVVRVEEGGNVTDRVATPQPTFACALGGEDGRTLHVLCSPGSHPDEVAGKGEGAIYTMRVEHPHAGRP